MTEVVLSKGQNCELPGEVRRLQLVVYWDEPVGPVDVDAAALLLNASGRVRSDEDFVFFNQPTSPEGALRHLGRPSSAAPPHERIDVDLGGIPEDVHKIAVTASVLEGCFGDLEGLRLLVLDDIGDALARYDISGATSETAVVFGEVYRRGDGWKLRAIGQGWDTGLAGLASDFGVTVEDTEDLQTDTPPPADPAATSADVVVTSPPTLAEPDSAASAAASVVPAGVDTAPQEPSPTTTPRRRPTGVRTSKTPTAALAAAPRLKLAGAETWQAARLFSISGVGTAEEQEKRATSGLLAAMMGVPAFARALNARFGAPVGTVETYLEVPFHLGESTVYPDGVIRVARGARIWTGLLEVKTGTGQLRRDQVENYLDVAREQGYDAVITLSNEIAPHAGEHPVAVDRRKLRKTTLFHLSWAEVLHEAKMTLVHRGAGSTLQAWLLAELIRYLEHPRSGAASFDDMGQAWVPVREAIAAGTLRASDRKVPAVADAWTRLVRHLCLRLSSDLGVTVAQALPRKLATDPASRIKAVTTRLATDGVLEAVLKVPLAAGPLTVVADLRTSQVRVSVHLQAPQEGTSQRRLTWLLRQLREAPDDLLVEALFIGRLDTACEKLGDVRASPAALLPDRAAEVTTFCLTQSSVMGTKRSGLRGAFVPSVTSAVEAFYSAVVQPLKPWVPPAPKLPEDVVSPPISGEESPSAC